MIVTVIVTGAVYGLIAGGQNAFVYEPERIERQQSIRIAMDVMTRDIASAGVSMPSFSQVFLPGGNDVGGVGPACVGGPCLPSTTIAAQNTDEVTLVVNNEGVDAERTCGDDGATGTATLWANWTRIQVNDLVLVFMIDGTWTLRHVSAVTPNFSTAALAPACDASPRVQLTFAPGDPNDPELNTAGLCDAGGFGTAAGSANCTVMTVLRGEVVSYRIRPATAFDQMPQLQRRASSSCPGAVFRDPDDSCYTVIARGIEDLQVQYAQADGDIVTPAPEEIWVDDAPPVNVVLEGVNPGKPDYSTLIVKARMALTARTDRMDLDVRNMQGATLDVNGVAGVRGSLMSTVVARSAVNTIGRDKTQYELWQ
jgi:hypothetical protein